MRPRSPMHHVRYLLVRLPLRLLIGRKSDRSSRRVDPYSNAGLRQVERLGFQGAGWRDLYHGLMQAPTIVLIGGLAGFYLFANVIFACIYLLFGSGITGAKPGFFSDAFFFSIQTMSTIGYGELAPAGLATHLIVAAEAVFGLLVTALSTSILFARLSRPTAQVQFGRHAVVTTFEEVPTLMFRVANLRRNQIVEAQMTLTVLKDIVTSDGHTMRRFYDMNLVRSKTPFFSLTWTVMHTIDADSPLYGENGDASEGRLDILCSMSGLDDIYGQTIHARHTYERGDIHWNKRLADIFHAVGNGRQLIDYSHFHDLTDEAP